MIIPTGVGARLMKWPWLTFALVIVNAVAFHMSWDRMADLDLKSQEVLREAVRRDVNWFQTYLFQDCHNRSRLSDASCQKTASILIWQYLNPQGKIEESPHSHDRLDLEAGLYVALKANGAFQKALYEYSQLSTRDGARVWEEVKNLHQEYGVFSSVNQNWWAAFRSLFFHADLSHLIGNMLMLIIFGSLLEQRISRHFYLAIYITAGFLGLLPMASISKDSLNYFVGNSGCIASLMGASWMAYRDFKMRCYFMPLFPTPFLARSFMVPVIWALPVLYFAGDILGLVANSGSVAFDAHLIGVAVGTIALFYDAKGHDLSWPWISVEEMEVFQQSKRMVLEERVRTLRHLSMFNFANYKSWCEWTRVAIKYRHEASLCELSRILYTRMQEQSGDPAAVKCWIRVFSDYMGQEGFELFFAKLSPVEVLGIAELALENERAALGFRLLMAPSIKRDLHWVVNNWVRRFKQKKLPKKFKDLAYSELSSLSQTMDLPGPLKIFYDHLAQERNAYESRAA